MSTTHYQAGSSLLRFLALLLVGSILFAGCGRPKPADQPREPELPVPISVGAPGIPFTTAPPGPPPDYAQ